MTVLWECSGRRPCINSQVMSHCTEADDEWELRVTSLPPSLLPDWTQHNLRDVSNIVFVNIYLFLCLFFNSCMFLVKITPYIITSQSLSIISYEFDLVCEIDYGFQLSWSSVQGWTSSLDISIPSMNHNHNS